MTSMSVRVCACCINCERVCRDVTDRVCECLRIR